MKLKLVITPLPRLAPFLLYFLHFALCVYSYNIFNIMIYKYIEFVPSGVSISIHFPVRKLFLPIKGRRDEEIAWGISGSPASPGSPLRIPTHRDSMAREGTVLQEFLGCKKGNLP